ncbi:hypothetical protein CUMW_125930 [Citrus unshiu]|nr:hypothetical protein CUMW_125930 [Citrus unshiu]
MRCHDPVGLKFLCTVDGDVAAYQWTKNLALFSTKPCHCSTRVKPCYCSSMWSNRVLLTDDVAQS